MHPLVAVANNVESTGEKPLRELGDVGKCSKPVPYELPFEKVIACRLEDIGRAEDAPTPEWHHVEVKCHHVVESTDQIAQGSPMMSSHACSPEYGGVDSCQHSIEHWRVIQRKFDKTGAQGTWFVGRHQTTVVEVRQTTDNAVDCNGPVVTKETGVPSTGRHTIEAMCYGTCQEG